LEHSIDKIFPAKHITRQQVEDELAHFKGEIWQTPPEYSAVKVNGKRAFDYARQGKEVELKPKQLVIDEIEILDFDLPVLRLRIACSKGTYIRALARDIGTALGSGAHLTALRRTRIGNVELKNCLDLDEFKNVLNTI
jgi:tRNA pseudouridine55 synthase